MALELIRNDRVIEALAPGAKRLTDGGGLYLLPAAKPGGQHGWRFDYVFEGKRKTISLGIFPAVSLAGARGKALDARKQLALGINPSDKRKQVKAAQASQLEAERRAQAGEAPIGSFEEVACWRRPKIDPLTPVVPIQI
jgi:hypothetical protein